MPDPTVNFEQLTAELICWFRKKMDQIGATRAVIGVSGGKDSTVVAALAAKAIGPENVCGVLMPNGEQKDIGDAREVCRILGIREIILPIHPIAEAFWLILGTAVEDKEGLSSQTMLNLPPRIRMTALYGLAQSIPGSLVINTGNLSEDWVGYATLYGDTAGAFSPLGMLVTHEVIQVGRQLGVPERLLVKPPADGLTGKTDEEVLGFSYEILNRYIRTGQIDDPALKERIDALHRGSRFKFLPIPMFPAPIPIAIPEAAGVYENARRREGDTF